MSCIQACMKAILVEDTAKERGYQHFIFSFALFVGAESR